MEDLHIYTGKIEISIREYKHQGDTIIFPIMAGEI